MRVALLVVLCVASAACDTVFRIDRIEGDAKSSPICLQDGFDTTLDASTWIPYGPVSGAVRVDAGVLRIDVPQQTTATQDPYGGVHTSTRNLTGAAFEVRLLAVPDVAARSLTGELFRHDGANSYSLFFQVGQVIARKTIAGMTKDSVWPYDAVSDEYLRMRHDVSANEIVFETRGKTTNWLPRLRLPMELDPSSIEVHLFAASFDVAPAYTALFDDALLTGPSCQP